MVDEEAKETEKSLVRANKVCGRISIILKIILVLICVWWIVATGLMIVSLFNGGPEEVSLIGLFLYIAHGLVLATLMFLLILIFSEPAHDRSPFGMIQVKRLRQIAGLLVLYAIFDFAVSCNAAYLYIDWSNFGATISSSPIATINFGPLMVAAAVFAFSFVFKYGVLLQKFSDDAL